MVRSTVSRTSASATPMAEMTGAFSAMRQGRSIIVPV
ncbi:MAG: hypothetical protein BWY76_01925 [bacterium ADurb.Bin429]|nr:MAG: hypothetical protein BWY76_01925 [bacterium ADurb.Bin429]